MKYTGKVISGTGLKRPSTRKYPTKQEYYLLIAEWKAAEGEKKRKLGEALINNVDPLIHKIARSFAQKYARFLNLDDFVQAGRIAVLNAIRTWDEEIATKHDVHFTTHVTCWLKSEMNRLVTKEGCQAVRLPHNAYSLNKQALAEGKTPQYPENIRCYSLSTVFGKHDEDDNDDSRADRFFHSIGAFSESKAEEETYTNQLGRKLSEALQCIPKKRDREILMRRLDGETLEHIAKSYDFSRERIRQICMTSIKMIGRRVKEKNVSV